MEQNLPCYREYGIPFYWASWVPSQQIKKLNADAKEEESNFDDCPTRYLVFGGGGGEGRTGVKNAILLAQFDFPTNKLSETVNRIGTDYDIPYRMAMHPAGEGFICSFPRDCRWFEWEVPENMETHNLSVRSSERKLSELEDVGMQQALAFNRTGSILAAGSEDGHLRVLKWPSLKVILDQADACKSMKDLDFSLDGKLLASLGGSGPCRILDLESSTTIASLPRKKGENFVFCRFSRSSNNQLVYVATIKQGQGYIISWNTASLKIVGSKKIVREPISAFNISDDGKLLAVGTTEGDVAIIDSCSLRVRQIVKKAHHFVVTAVEFSQDCRALVSVSVDWSARVTVIEDQNQKQRSLSIWAFIFVVLLAVLVFYLKQNGAF